MGIYFLEGYFQIGHIAKLHGFKGEVSLFLDVTQPEEYYQHRTIFISHDGIATPFLIESLKPMNKGFVVIKLDGINNESEAKSLLHQAVFMPDAHLPELDEHSFYDHEIEGYKVFDTERGFIGLAMGVIDHPSNPLLQLEKEGIEGLIPLNLELQKKVDRKERTLTITCPPGLLEVYFS